MQLNREKNMKQSKLNSGESIANTNLIDTSGNRLRYCLDKKGWANTDAALNSGLTLTTIANVLNEKVVRRGTILKLSKALGISPEKIVPNWDKQ